MRTIEPRFALREHMKMSSVDNDASRDLRIGGAEGRGARIVFRFDGADIAAYEGESIAAALLAAGIRAWPSPPNGPPSRTIFCAMGVCQQCAVEIDSRRVEACRTRVRAGLEVRSTLSGTPPR